MSTLAYQHNCPQPNLSRVEPLQLFLLTISHNHLVNIESIHPLMRVQSTYCLHMVNKHMLNIKHIQLNPSNADTMGPPLRVWNMEAPIFQRLPIYIHYRRGKRTVLSNSTKAQSRAIPCYINCQEKLTRSQYCAHQCYCNMQLLNQSAVADNLA